MLVPVARLPSVRAVKVKPVSALVTSIHALTSWLILPTSSSVNLQESTELSLKGPAGLSCESYPLIIFICKL